ncbi:hypothetical protein GOP47_0030187, partial [Adiantum capillus-veneris]
MEIWGTSTQGWMCVELGSSFPSGYWSFGYVALEYAYGGKITAKGDVYSFGDAHKKTAN